MSREDDWKVHEYMGNDLTGWEWDKYDENGDYVIKTKLVEDEPVYHERIRIPHYSTTWEGAGLVMERLREQKYRVRSQFSYNECSVWIEEYIGEQYLPWTTIGLGVEQSFPLALCKAYISAMEERDNG